MPRKAKRKRGLCVPMVEAAKDVPWFEVQGHEKVKAPRFSGALHKPIIQSSTGDMDGVMASIISQRVEKLILLLKHYNIGNTDHPWLLLSLRRACAFVPGLQILRETPRSRGRTRRWTDKTREDLIAAVESVRSEEKGRTDERAVEILKQRDPSRWALVPRAQQAGRRRPSGGTGSFTS
jgi:hypothetical protein